MNLELRMRASHVKRWQIVQVSREQTLAEHSFNVAMIAERINSDSNAGLDMAEVYRWALHHDLIEVLTGDLNTVFKARVKDIYGSDATDRVESGIDVGYDNIKHETCDLVKFIVKLADTIDAYVFLDLHGVGHHARNEVSPRIFEHLQQLAEYGDVKWRIRPQITYDIIGELLP